MLDEFEIVSWVVYLEQFNLLNFTFDVNNTHAVLQDALLNIFYIGLSTKLLLNDSAAVKARITVHLSKADPDFHTRYHHWGFVYGSYFEHRPANSLLQTNKILNHPNVHPMARAEYSCGMNNELEIQLLDARMLQMLLWQLLQLSDKKE